MTLLLVLTGSADCPMAVIGVIKSCMYPSSLVKSEIPFLLLILRAPTTIELAYRILHRNLMHPKCGTQQLFLEHTCQEESTEFSFLCLPSLHN